MLLSMKTVRMERNKDLKTSQNKAETEKEVFSMNG